MSAIKIHSQTAILVEGAADEFIPNAEEAVGMHGFAIVVPPGEGGERLLDMLWRITMAYAVVPRLLASRTMVRKMVEAVWSKESREPKPMRRPARKSGLAEGTQRDRLDPAKAVPSRAEESSARDALLDRLRRQPAINAGRSAREELYERQPKSGKKRPSSGKN